MNRGPSPEPGFPSPTRLAERGAILAAGVILAAALFYLYLPSPPPPPDTKYAPEPVEIDPSANRPDPTILAEIRDASARERGALESDAWAHLLRKAYNLTPAVAKALNGGNLDVERLRSAPDRYRGQYVWCKGRLVEFKAEDFHPLPRATAYKGRLETPSGEPVIFWVSKPLPQEVVADGGDASWVRLEGFFMKIRDEFYHERDDVLNAPLIIGPRLEPSYPDWDPVLELDAGILSGVQNARWVADEWVDVRDFHTRILESEDVPLWHIGNYARHRFETEPVGSEHQLPLFDTKTQLDAFKSGEYPQGTSIRLRGTYRDGDWWAAKTNPAGIQYWSAIWIQIPRLGGKTVPVWIPARIADLKYGHEVDITAYFFKNLAYRVLDPEAEGLRYTPVFVAGGVRIVDLSPNLMSHWFAWVGSGFAVMLIGVFFFLGRQARRESENHRESLIVRRRHRRGPRAEAPVPVNE
jgi:hypothetical protein